eukprot:tig00000248_g21801.t1
MPMEGGCVLGARPVPAVNDALSRLLQLRKPVPRRPQSLPTIRRRSSLPNDQERPSCRLPSNGTAAPELADACAAVPELQLDPTPESLVPPLNCPAWQPKPAAVHPSLSARGPALPPAAPACHLTRQLQTLSRLHALGSEDADCDAHAAAGPLAAEFSEARQSARELEASFYGRLIAFALPSPHARITVRLADKSSAPEHTWTSPALDKEAGIGGSFFGPPAMPCICGSGEKKGTESAREVEHVLRASAICNGRSAALTVSARGAPDGCFDPATRIFLHSAAHAIATAEALRWVRREKAREDLLWKSDTSRVVFSALDSTREGIAIANAQGSQLVYGNASYERLTGFKFHEVVGLLCPILGCVEAGSETHASLVAALTAGRNEILEFPARRRDGTPWWAQVHLQPVRCAATGEITNWLGLVRDVTAQKVAEVAQKAARAALATEKEKAGRAEAASQAKSSWVSYTSHELRTPLHGLIASTQLLLETDPLTADQRELAEGIRASGNGLLDFLDDVLDFAKIEAGKLQLLANPFGLRGCIDSAVHACAARAKAGVHLACSVEIDGRLPRGGPVGDEGKLKQVLINVTSNALKFTDEGAVAVRCRAIPFDAEAAGARAGAGAAEGGALLEVAVEDTGCGIKEEDLPKLFASFVQVGDSGARRSLGTGLGLCIAKAIVEGMQGEMRVESRFGAGTTVYFTARVGWSPAGSEGGEEGGEDFASACPAGPARAAAVAPGLPPIVREALESSLRAAGLAVLDEAAPEAGPRALAGPASPAPDFLFVPVGLDLAESLDAAEAAALERLGGARAGAGSGSAWPRVIFVAPQDREYDRKKAAEASGRDETTAAGQGSPVSPIRAGQAQGRTFLTTPVTFARVQRALIKAATLPSPPAPPPADRRSTVRFSPLPEAAVPVLEQRSRPHSAAAAAAAAAEAPAEAPADVLVADDHRSTGW